MEATVFIWKDEDWYIAYEPTSGIATQGKTEEEAIINIKEALQLYVEEGKEVRPLRYVMVTTIRLDRY